MQDGEDINLEAVDDTVLNGFFFQISLQSHQIS